MRVAYILVILLVSFSTISARAAPIVGGTPTRSEDWPDVVAVLGKKGLCTGTLVAPDVVVTAAHCIDIEPVYVVTHADSLEPGAPADHVAVKWSRAYPRWQERFDVGVIVLQRMARTRPRAIATACLANERLAAGAPVTIVGYGQITPDASDANTRLQQARLAVIDPFCERAPGCLPAARPNGEIAAGGRGIDACYGDSGGPAYLETESGYALVGVISRALDIEGQPCGNGGIYVRADKVVAWIQSVTERRLERVGCRGPGDDPEADEEELEVASGCVAGRGAGPGALVLVGIAVFVRRRRAGTRSVGDQLGARLEAAVQRRQHGEDQGEESRRRDGRRRDDPHHLAFHQGEADPPVPRDRSEVLRSRHREP